MEDEDRAGAKILMDKSMLVDATEGGGGVFGDFDANGVEFAAKGCLWAVDELGYGVRTEFEVGRGCGEIDVTGNCG